MSMSFNTKKLSGTKWVNIDLTEYAQKSLVKFYMESADTLITAVYMTDDQTKPAVFITNSKEEKEKYALKAPTFHMKEFMELLGAEICREVMTREDRQLIAEVAEVFPEAKLGVFEMRRST